MSKLQRFVLCSLALTLMALMASSASAQVNARFRVAPWRLTIPANTVTNGTVTFSNFFTFGTNISDNITLAVTNLPPGLTVANIYYGPATNSGFITNSVILTNNVGNGFPAFTNANGTRLVYVEMNYIGVAPGVTNIFMSCSGGATGSVPMEVQAASIWAGRLNARASGSGISVWSTATNWLGGAAPGTSDDVVFTDIGGQTNPVYLQTNTAAGATNTSVVYTTNVLITGSDVTVGSIRFAQTNGNAPSTANHVLALTAGRTLNVLGTNGFSIFSDYVPGNQTVSAPNVVLIGTGNAKLIVSNSLATFGVSVGGGIVPVLNMSNLDNVVVDVNRILLGDSKLFPFFRNYNDVQAIGNLAPRQQALQIHWGRTNSIRATFADPFNYNNVYDRGYSLSFIDQEGSGNGGGTTCLFLMGVTNNFFLDSVNFIGASSQTGNSGRIGFNIGLSQTNNNNAILQGAVFRGTNGGRMSMFCVTDDAGNTNQASSNCKGVVDFASGNGYVDILVDRLYLARDRVLIGSNQSPNVVADLYINKGIIDANTVILGYQHEDGKTNWRAIDGVSQSYLNWCEGRLFITNGGTLKVNNSLTLGFTADSNPAPGGNTFSTFGQLTLQRRSTGLVNTVLCDPGLGLSTANTITVAQFSNLILSNTIASASKAIDTLTLNNTSTLTMHIDGTVATPYIYVTNIVTSGGGNILNFASIKNISSYPATIDLIDYKSGGVNLAARGPAGFTLGLQETGDAVTPGRVQVIISTNPPKNLYWRGSVSSSWNFVDKNWSLDGTAALTNFATGDFVTFEDNAAYPTNISIAQNGILPSGVNVTNGTIQHIFSDGGGTIVGTGVLTNSGPGVLRVDANVSLAIALNSGSLIGNGSVGEVDAVNGTTISFGGDMGGGVVTAGSATLLPTGTIEGGVSIQTGGVFTNYGACSGVLAMQSGAPGAPTVLHNGTGGTLLKFNTFTTPTNSLLVNVGSLGLDTDTDTGFNDILTIGGEFRDMGVGDVVLTTLTINGGNTNSAGLFYPGGSSSGATIGTTTVRNSNVPSGLSLFPGRVLFQKNSTNVFNVDLSAGQPNTVVNSGFTDLGGSVGIPTFGGCTLVLNNNGPAYTNGTILRLFINGTGNNVAATGNATNQYPRILPAIPGPGLAWDLSSINGTSVVTNGIIKIRAVETNATNLSFTYSFGISLISNSDNTLVTGSNRLVITHLTWPTQYIGWALEQQQNATKFDSNNPSVILGISTNWDIVFRSVWTNDVLWTNPFNANLAQFFRMIYPVPDPDLIGITQ